MGVLEFKSKGTTYLHELETHQTKRKIELPVKSLNAVFVETGGIHPTSVRHLETLLNKKEKIWEGIAEKNVEARTTEIVKTAKKNGTEIWIGDIKPTKKENIHSGIIDTAAILARAVAGGVLGGSAAAGVCGLCSPNLIFGLWLARKGNANKRKISRRITTLAEGLNPATTIRDAVMANKIRKLSELTGHNKIGILTGAGHVGMADILEKEKPLTEKQRSKISARGPDALKMFRCIYDKAQGKWRVEEHSL
ncbi:MAG: hypothetical protein Q8R15_02295 [Candidatus Micrarchaeota archaeon]|nr:hypothetical protein [Candidatus Micrarchaeota archaeon]